MNSERDFLLPPRHAAVQLVAGRAHYEVVVAAVRAAKVSVWIATANLKALLVEDERPPSRRSRRRSYVPVLEVFDTLAGQGVELRILHGELPSRPFRDAFDAHPRLVEGGLELRCCPRNHSKIVVVDGSLLYLGSANWTGAGLGAKGSARRNFELGVVTRDPTLLDEVQRYYDALWRGVECAGCGLRDRCEAPLDSF